jgi:hypothetical protein
VGPALGKADLSPANLLRKAVAAGLDCGACGASPTNCLLLAASATPEMT